MTMTDTEPRAGRMLEPSICTVQGCNAAPDYVTTITFNSGDSWVIGQCWGHAPRNMVERGRLAQIVGAKTVAVRRAGR